MKRSLLGRIFAIFAAAAILTCAAAGPAWCQGAKRVVILPFTANASKDIGYLIKGIRDMLASRLAWQDKVSVVEPDLVDPWLKKVPGPYNDEKAREIGKGLKADVVVFGSITMLGKSISVDARVVKVEEGGAPLTAFVQAPDMDQVIPRINQFAQRINAEIFRRPDAVAAMKKEGSSEDKASGGEVGGSGSLVATEGGGETQMSPLNPEFMRKLYGVDSDSTWRSPRIRGVVVSLSVGDVDGDGKNELVVLLKDRVRIFRRSGNFFQLVSELRDGPKGQYFSVDVADLDGDGKAEIYVTNRVVDTLESFVVTCESNGRMRFVAKDVPYYFRIQPKPDGTGYWLFGQRTAVDTPFWGPVYELKRDGEKFSQVREINLPKLACVLNFVLADLNGTGNYMPVVVGPSYHLRVYSPGGNQLYVSSDTYCASANYIPYYAVADAGYDEQWWYLYTRLLAVDQDGDGRQEIIAVRNSDRAGMILERSRMFYRGTIFSLSWNGSTLVENWRTPRISGYVSDYNMGDVGNTGQNALALAFNQSELGGMLEKAYSYVVAFTIKLNKDESKRMQQQRYEDE